MQYIPHEVGVSVRGNRRLKSPAWARQVIGPLENFNCILENGVTGDGYVGKRVKVGCLIFREEV